MADPRADTPTDLDARIGLTILHLWRHPRYVADCKVCLVISPKPKVRRD